MAAPHWDFKDGTAPATPASGYGRLYVKNDGTFHFINDSGTDTELGAGGGGGGGAGIMGWDEGVPLGTGTILNAVGDGLTLTLSGTVLDLTFALPAHASTHENGGSDEISVAGLSGLLADNQNPTAHASEHTDGTDDIQDANSGQKGLMTAAYATKVDGIQAGAQVNFLPGQDEGIIQGTGTILNVAGGGLELNISGTVLEIDSREAAKFGFSILMGDGSGTFPVGLQVPPVEVPFAGNLSEWTLLADITGSVQLRMWKDTYANFPPTSADVVFSPVLSGQRKNTATIDVDVAEGDIIQAYIETVSTIKGLTLGIKGSKS